MKIPKILGHIWIGPLQPPLELLNTWKEKHPNWEYHLYDNNFLKSFNFKNINLINYYMELELYAGVADLMRYEILYEYGGFLPEADSICYLNTDELFLKSCAYTVYENEFLRGKLVSPILACEPKNIFVGQLIEELSQLKLSDLDTPWKTTGNLFVAQMIEKYNPDITIFPSHYFIPVHFEGLVYSGNDKVYSKQLFGTTRNKYQTPKNLAKDKLSFFEKIKDRPNRIQKRIEAEILAEKKEYFTQKNISSVLTKFDIDFSDHK